MSFLLGPGLFSGAMSVSFREGIFLGGGESFLVHPNSSLLQLETASKISRSRPANLQGSYQMRDLFSGAPLPHLQYPQDWGREDLGFGDFFWGGGVVHVDFVTMYQVQTCFYCLFCFGGKSCALFCLVDSHLLNIIGAMSGTHLHPEVPLWSLVKTLGCPLNHGTWHGLVRNPLLRM